MLKEKQNISKRQNNILVRFSIWGIKVIYRKYIKVWKSKRDMKKGKKTLCSYHPHCSEYSIFALQKYGFFKGWIKTIKRVSKCTTYQHTQSCIDFP